MKRGFVFLWVTLAAMFLPLYAHGMVQLDIDKELLLLKEGRSELHIPGAQFRVAVFTFEDPDDTGLGNALAKILSHDILVRSKVGSIGVLRYVGGLSSSAPGALSYYDKVEVLTEAQQATLAVWGVVQRQGEHLFVDTYVQIPPHTLNQAFVWKFRLPQAMGGADLSVQLNPDRILVQRYEVAVSEIERLLASAKRANELRNKADDQEPVFATLPMDSVYYLQKRQDDWVLMNAGSQRTGWVRATGYCKDACAPLLDSSKFISSLLVFIKSHHRTPRATPSLAPDAHAVCDQLLALLALDEAPPDQSEREAMSVLDRWFEPAETGQNQVPPGGATMANLRAVIRIVGALKRESIQLDDAFDQLKLSPDQVEEIADELARASLIDPRNAVVLRNLSVLFAYIEDHKRAELAGELASQAELTSRSTRM